MIENVELVTLIQTLVAAREGSFHKAGELLGVPASTISRRVRSLETHIGIKLFDRHRHGIRSTAVGEVFLVQIQHVLDELKIALVNASTIAQGKMGWLKIGTYVSPSAGHLRAALSDFKESFPNVDLQYIEGRRYDLVKRLNTGAIDVAIVADHFRSGLHEVIPLWQEKILVAMPASHRLAGKTDLSWDDLRKVQIFIGRDPGPELRDHLVAQFKTFGDVPSIHQFDVGRDFSLSLVGIEPEVTLLYEADARTGYPSVIYRELTDRRGPSLVRYYACWLSNNDNPALRSFLDLVRRRSESDR
jgi:DNA-binding transcriptional LysR family regulator